MPPLIITIISTAAAVISIISTLPQIQTMLSTRVSAGQSPLGWALGALCDLALATVNWVGYHSVVLAGGNLISLVLCLTAMALIFRFRDNVPPRSADEIVSDLDEMHTMEFEILHGAVLVEKQRRAERRVEPTVVELAPTEHPTGEFAAQFA